MFKPDLTAQDLQGALDPGAPQKVIRKLFDYCHAMAIAYVRMKTASGAFQPDRLGLTPEDFALDSVAELFRRDDSGLYPVFEGICRSAQTTSAPFHDQLRRLVLGSVNQHIFRSFRETDPGLARLIRNIKFTLKSHANAHLLRVNDELVIAPTQGELLPHLPLFTEELMLIEFWNAASVGSSLRELLSILVQILLDQSLYRRVYPVTAFALLIRCAYQQREALEQTADAGPHSYDEDIGTVATDIVRGTTGELLTMYCSRGKLPLSAVQAYGKAVMDILCETFVQGDGDSASYFEILQRHIPGLTKDDYVQRHRTKLEYVAKQAKEAMKRALQKEFSVRSDDRNDSGE